MSYSGQKSYSNDGDSEDDSVLYKVYVQRIDPEVDEEILTDLFSKYGEPFKVFIHPEKRFGLVYFTSLEEASVAISKLNLKYPLKCQVKMGTPPTERITVAELIELNKKIKQQEYLLARKEACINELKLECQNLRDLMINFSVDQFQKKLNYTQRSRYGRINGQYDGDSFESDVSGDLDLADYPSSRYRNYAETYMNIWMRREMPHIFNKFNGAGGDHYRSTSRQSRYSSNYGDGPRDRSYSRGRKDSHNDETSSQYNRYRSKSSSRPAERNFESKSAPSTPNFENKSALRPNEQNFGPTERNFENKSVLRPNERNFGSNARNFGPNERNFENKSAFRPNEQNFGPNERNFENKSAFRPNTRNFDNKSASRPNEQNFGSNERNFDNKSAFRPNARNFDNKSALRPNEQNFENKSALRPNEQSFENKSAFRPNEQNFGSTERNFENKSASRPNERSFENKSALRPNERSFDNKSALRPNERSFDNKSALRPNEQNFGSTERNFDNKSALRPNERSFENKSAFRPNERNFEHKSAPSTPQYENNESYANRRYHRQETNFKPAFNRQNDSGQYKNRNYNGQNKYVKADDGDDEFWGGATAQSSPSAAPKPNLVSKPLPSKQQITVKQYQCVVPIVLPEDVFTEVKVQYTETEMEGWVSLVKNEDVNLDILAKVNDMPKKPMSPFVNDVCMALYDGVWNRAVVLKVLPNKFLVRFLDFGNTEYVTGDLCELDEELKNIEGQVVRIKLDDGSDCKLEDEKVMKVKPVRKEGNTIVVHVPNGYYPMNNQTTVKRSLPPSSDFIENQTSNKINGFRSILEHLDVGDAGYIAVRSSLGKNNCTVTIASPKFVKKIEILESLGKEYENANKNHLAHRGDYVTSLYEDKLSRAIVLGTENDKKSWRVAFIDEGVCQLVSQTFPLRDIDFDIPAFACLCSIVSIQSKSEIEVLDTFVLKVISISHEPELTAKCQLVCEGTGENVAVVNLVQWRPKVLDANESLVDVPPHEDVFMTSDLPVLQPESGDAVYLCNFRYQNEACVQNLKMQKNAFELLKMMQQFTDKLTPLSNPPIKNQLVVCKFSGDGKWYRAEILKTLGATVEVLYIDYGNIEDVNVTLLREMIPEFTDIPMCVCKVTLKDVPKQNITIQQKGYLNSVLGDVKFNIFYEGSIENGVMIIDTSGDVLNKKMLSLRNLTPEQKTSTSTNENVSESEVRKQTSGRTSKVCSPSGSAVDVSKGAVKKQTSKVSSPCESAVSVGRSEVRKQRSTVNSESSDKSERSVGKKASSLVEVKIGRKVTVPERVLPKGISELVYLAEIDIPSGLISVCVHDTNEIEFLTETLTAEIVEYVTAEGPTEPYLPEPGDYCLAMYEDSWYRAKCVEPNKDEATVVFIDFGNLSDVSSDYIKKLPEKFAKFNALSAICKIDGLPDVLSPEQETNLTSLITPQHVYTAEVMSIDEDNVHVIKFPQVTAAFQ